MSSRKAKEIGHALVAPIAMLLLFLWGDESRVIAMNSWWHHPTATEERYPQETRLVLIPRLLDLGFTKEDVRSALECSSIQVVKDDLHVLRQKHIIGPDLYPSDLSTRLSRVIPLCAQLEGLESWDATLRSVLLCWMRKIVREQATQTSFAFPTLVASSGEVIPITIRRSHRRPA